MKNKKHKSIQGDKTIKPFTPGTASSCTFSLLGLNFMDGKFGKFLHFFALTCISSVHCVILKERIKEV